MLLSNTPYQSRLARLAADVLTALLLIAPTAVAEAISPEDATAEAQVRPHPIPPGDAVEVDYTVTIEGESVPVVRWYGPFCYAHASVPRDRDLSLAVRAREEIASHTISPRREAFDVAVTGDTAAFTVSGRNYIRFQANDLKTLFLFLDPPEVDPPTANVANVVSILDYGVGTVGEKVVTAEINRAIEDVSSQSDKNVLYFPPGLYRSGTVILQSNVMLYLAAGALLKASGDPTHFHRDHPGGHYRRLNFVTAYKVSNCGIRGRGVIDGNANFLRPKLAQLPSHVVVGGPGKVDANRVVNVLFSHAENAVIKGVFSRNSSSWNTVPHYCTDVAIENYKVISDMVWRGYKNEDAIDPDSCVRLTIRDSFFMARDDAIVLKTAGMHKGQRIAPDGASRDMHDVLVKNNVIWTETAALKYGYNESEASDVYNIRMEDNVILTAREGVQIRPKGPAVFRDSVFRRNWYEGICKVGGRDGRNYLLSDDKLRNLLFVDEKHDTFGTAVNIVRGAPGAQIRFENLRIDGQYRRSDDDARMQVSDSKIMFSSPQK